MKEIKITGKPARKIIITDKEMRKLDPKEIAKALGAEPIGIKSSDFPQLKRKDA